MLWTHANRGPIGRFGFDEPVLRSQEDTEIVMRVGVIRIELNRAMAGNDGLIQLESITQDDREIAVPVRRSGSSSRLRSINATACSVRPS